MTDHMSKHVDVRQEYSAASRILNSLASRCLEIWSNKFFRIWYVTSTMLLSLSTGTKYCLWSPYIKHDHPSNILIERLSLVLWLKDLCHQNRAQRHSLSFCWHVTLGMVSARKPKIFPKIILLSKRCKMECAVREALASILSLCFFTRPVKAVH